MTNNQYCSPPVLRKMTLSFVIATLLIEELNVYVMTDKLSFKLRSTSSTTHNLSCSHRKTARQINTLSLAKRLFFMRGTNTKWDSLSFRRHTNHVTSVEPLLYFGCIPAEFQCISFACILICGVQN